MTRDPSRSPVPTAWKRLPFVLAVAALLLLSSCSSSGSPSEPGDGAGTFRGQTRPLGSGTLWSWVATDQDGNPTAIGVSFTEAALSGLPGAGAAYTLTLPPQAVATAFDHVVVNWNPAGHPPPGIYDVPHFDFHFFLIGEAERDATSPADPAFEAKASQTPPASSIPEGYVATPGGVPGEGAHWVDPASPELNGQPFTRTLIYGFYAGAMIHVEPMITHAFLTTRSDVTVPIKLPTAYPQPGYYPTAFSVRYDESERLYTISLDGLTLRP